MEVSLPLPSHVRRRVMEFLLESSLQLPAPPIVKYTALSFFTDRFLPSLPCFLQRNTGRLNWLLNPLRESNLQLFALVSIWISSKIHDTRPLSIKSLKSLGDNVIVDQHFTTRDFAEAELVFMEVFRFDIGASKVAYGFLEDLLIQFRELSRVGDLVSLDLCTHIMDLLYETEETSKLLLSPHSLAASVLVTAYLLSVPKQQWEFPVLPWVKSITSYEEQDIGEMVIKILKHILSPEMAIQGITRAAS
ncbi:hypothetical protein J5N97_005916 [Dioscorea zingiberensis]|uniref:Cyclin N-terminal domain-containing protein n=1 Tax=Dioscorea zingiberensis TaxID=325984 RepID=A0A9D5D911_9LILI|nr:hypothetical protein J5N97_005916 [Dioscorea zingiberensis]